MEWQPIETAPKEQDVLVWYDHDADPYVEDKATGRLTDYAAWAESSGCMNGNGICIAKWFDPEFETEDEYGNGYWLPGMWFCKENDDYPRVCNARFWMPLPEPPK